MTAARLIAELRARGVTLVADGERLRCRPRSALSEADLVALRTRKEEVLAHLLSPSRTSLVCFACKERLFWRSIRGIVVCGVCHPPAAQDVVAEWVESSASGATDD